MIYIKLILTAFFWGGTFIAGKMIAQSVHPLNAAFLRFSIAAICLVGMVRHFEGRLPALNIKQLIAVVFLGLTGVFAYNIFFFSGLRHIEAGRASIIIANNPIVISLLSAVIFKERLNWIKSAGICLSVAGAMVVVSNGAIADLPSYAVGPGELMILGCVASWSAYSIIGKVALKSLSPLVAVAYSATAGALFLSVPAFSTGLFGHIPTYGLREWVSLVYLACFGTVLGFFWYYQGLETIGPMRASVFINFVPVSAILLSFFILKESLSFFLVVGGMMVVTGVYLTNASSVVEGLLGNIGRRR